MKDKLIIVGAGNVGGFLALNQDLFQKEYEIVGFLDDDNQKSGKNFWGIPVLGGIDKINNFKDHSIVIGISNPGMKKKVLEQIGEDYNFPNFIAKNAWLSNKVEIGYGVIIYPHVSINYESKIDNFVIINMNCAIGHNASIGKGCSLAPGINFAGFTFLEPFVEIGIGVCTKQGIKVAEHAVIGGQSMLTTDVEANSMYVGIPGKKIKSI